MIKFQAGDIIAWGDTRKDRWRILALKGKLAEIVCVKTGLYYKLGENYHNIDLTLSDSIRIVKASDQPHHPLTSIFK